MYRPPIDWCSIDFEAISENTVTSYLIPAGTFKGNRCKKCNCKQLICTSITFGDWFCDTCKEELTGALSIAEEGGKLSITTTEKGDLSLC